MIISRDQCYLHQSRSIMLVMLHASCVLVVSATLTNAQGISIDVGTYAPPPADFVGVAAERA